MGTEELTKPPLLVQGSWYGCWYHPLAVITPFWSSACLSSRLLPPLEQAILVLPCLSITSCLELQREIPRLVSHSSPLKSFLLEMASGAAFRENTRKRCLPLGSKLIQLTWFWVECADILPWGKPLGGLKTKRERTPTQPWHLPWAPRTLGRNWSSKGNPW